MRRSRLAVVLILAVCYAALFYSLMHPHALRSARDGGPMFSAVISQIGELRLRGLVARPVVPPPEDQTSEPARHWSFPPIDLWPSPAGRTATTSEFTPVTEARADNPVTQQPRQSTLRMVRWVRPEYPAALASAGQGGCVALELQVDPSGQPIAIEVARSSGWPEIDASASSAARRWRFSPPFWNSRPVAVDARVEVRYHAGAQAIPPERSECDPDKTVLLLGADSR